MRIPMLAGAIALSLLSQNVYALSVGSLKVDSYLGEPLDISIDISSIDQDEFSTLDVSLASREMFSEAGIEYPRNAGKLHLELGPYDDGKATISVKTAGAVSDPFVHLLLKISWSGGNILREYTALIDPADYSVEPIVQAAAPATSLGTTKAVPSQAETTAEELIRSVKAGDTLSAIAALYRPADVSIQQAWMAFYNLNQDAFPDANLNKIKKGARLRIPGEAQMKAMSQADALREVRKLSRPLGGAQPQTSGGTGSTPVQKPATLVVGGSSNATLAAEVPAESGQMAVSNAENITLSDLQGYDQLASIVTELGSFTQTIKQEISDSRGRDALLKEELIAARGENRVLTGRMARLEEQLSRMSQLLELQSNALQALNTNLESGGVTAAPGLALNQLEPAEIAPEPVVTPDVAVEPPVVPAVQSDEAPKTYYEQLLEVAISDAPEEDVSYIEEVLKLSSTSIGEEDTNPVTPEMQAKAAARKPASPAVPADQATATMLANVRASLGQLPGTSDGAASAPKLDVKIASQDSAYIDALNEEDRSQIQKSEARIVALQKQLQAKIDASKQTATDTSDTSPKTPETGAKKPAAEKRSMAEGNGTETSLVASLMDQARSGLSVLSTMAGGISQDIWRLMGGIGAAVIGFMVMVGLRRRKEGGSKQDKGGAVSHAFAESAPDVADIATKSMQHEPEEDEDLEEELHGSSLFDLSDESFMASEAIQDDSSLFSMDDDNDDFDSLTDMDSAQFGQHSELTQTVDVDPIAEADVYLAYDRKEQAIEVLEQALSSDPNQSSVVIKLLGLFKASENIEGFTRLFESSAEHIEDDSDWNKIKLMAQEFVPGHEMLADDFDSSIPVLMDEVVDDPAEADTSSDIKLSMSSDTENLASLLLDEEEKSLTPDLKLASSDNKDSIGEDGDGESLNISLDSDEALKLDEELDSAVEEVNQHEPDTALALAKAYIELGEEDIARDFLLDVVNAGSADLKTEAEEMLASLG